jgi:two-component system, cell cycle sensor histidine kinase and response regulator CckA
LLEQRKTEPLLVLIDVLMPRMDGLTLARKISTKLRRSKIVIISGHMTDLSWWPADLREVTFMPKPFRMADLTVLLQTAQKEFAGLA